MRTSNRLTCLAVGLAVAVAWMAPVAGARSRKADKLISQVRAAEARKEWDKALELVEQALSQDPTDISYQLTATRIRFSAAQFHIDHARKLRAQGQLPEALAEFEKAYAINPAFSLAEEEVRRTRAIMEREKTKPPATPEERGLTPAQLSRKESEAKFATMQALPELKPLNPQPITLKMNNQPPKVLFETLGKLAGINVLFDPEYAQASPRGQSIEFNGSTLEESLDYLAMVTKSFWKPLSSNAIFVTQDNPTKRRDYEEQVVKVFYLQNVTTAQEIQEILTALRTVAEIQKVFTYQSQNAIIARAEADKIALAEKIVADLDKPKSEVVVDILVMQVNKNYTRNLAAAIAPTGINSPIGFTPRPGLQTVQTTSSTSSTDTGTTTTPTTTPTTTTGSSTGSIPIINLKRISSADFSITLPGGLLEALLSDTRTKVLQSPQVRAIDAQKVSLKIGQRVPYATGSFQPGIGGVGINPLVNTQFTFLDVGVNVDITPRIHGADEVSLHVEVDISNVADHVNLGGIDQPVVGQSKITSDVRLRQGEVNLVGGLMQQQDTKTTTGVPGLSSIPILGHLFTSDSVVKSESELVLAIIPHIVRSPDISDVNLRGIAAGNSTTVKLNYAPRRVSAPESPAAPAAPSPAPTAAPQTPPATVPDVVGVPKAPPASGQAAVPAGPVPQPLLAPGIPLVPPAQRPAVEVKTEAAATLSETVPAGTMRVMFTPGQASVQLNAPITINLEIENPADFVAAPMKIAFDPKILRLNDVTQGPLLEGNGQKVAFSKNVLNDQGEAIVSIGRLPGAPGITASGQSTLVTLVFQAVGRGDTTITLPQLTLRNSKGQTIAAPAPQLTVNVK